MNSYDKVMAIINKRNLKVYKVEQKAGLSNGVISKWKQGNPRLFTLVKVAVALGVEAEDLLPDGLYNNNYNEVAVYKAGDLTKYTMEKLAIRDAIHVVIENDDLDPIFITRDILIIDPNAEIEFKDWVAVKTNNRLQIMLYTNLKGSKIGTLRSLDDEEHLENTSEVLGKIVGYTRRKS